MWRLNRLSLKQNTYKTAPEFSDAASHFSNLIRKYQDILSVIVKNTNISETKNKVRDGDGVKKQSGIVCLLFISRETPPQVIAVMGDDT